MTASESRLLLCANWIYRVMLRAYPPAFRVEYRREMALVFRDGARDVIEHGGVWALLLFSLWIVGDWLKTALLERADIEHIRRVLPLGAE